MLSIIMSFIMLILELVVFTVYYHNNYKIEKYKSWLIVSAIILLVVSYIFDNQYRFLIMFFGTTVSLIYATKSIYTVKYITIPYLIVIISDILISLVIRNWLNIYIISFIFKLFLLIITLELQKIETTQLKYVTLKILGIIYLIFLIIITSCVFYLDWKGGIW